MNIKKSLIGSASVYTVANVINAGIPFLLLPVLTRIIGPSEYGKVAMFATVLAFFSAFTGFNSHGALGVRYFQQKQYDLSGYISTCFAILCGSLILIIGLVSLGISWLERFTQLPAKWLIVAAVSAGAQFAFQIPLTLWRSSNQPFKYAFIQIAQSVTNAALSLCLVIALEWGWEGVTAGQSLSLLFFTILIFLFPHKYGWTKASPRKDYAMDALKFGIPLIPHTFGSMLMMMSDRFMITNFLGIEETGIYMVGMQIGMGVGLLTQSFNKAFAPWLFGKLSNIDNFSKIRVVRYTYIYFVIVLTIALLLGLMAPWFLGFFVGEKFRQASGVVIYIALGYAFGGMYLMVTNYIYYVSKTYFLAIITLISGFLNIILNYFLIQLLGLKGAAIGFLVSQILFFFGTWFLSNKVYPMPWRKAILQ